MKNLGELLFNLKDDPEKERLREKTLAKARAWEEAEPPPRPPPAFLPPPPPPMGPGGAGGDPLRQRLMAAWPDLNDAQKRMLETLLDSWGC